MSNDIHIDKLKVDVRIQRHIEPMEFVKNATAIIKEKVLPLLENLLNAANLGEQDIELDHLTIDMNARQESNWPQQLAQTLFTEITENLTADTKQSIELNQLEDKAIVHTQSDLPLSHTEQFTFSEQIIAQLQNEEVQLFQLLVHFLEEGFLPNKANLLTSNFQELETKCISTSESIHFIDSLLQYLKHSVRAKKRFLQHASLRRWLRKIIDSYPNAYPLDIISSRWHAQAIFSELIERYSAGESLRDTLQHFTWNDSPTASQYSSEASLALSSLSTHEDRSTFQQFAYFLEHGYLSNESIQQSSSFSFLEKSCIELLSKESFSISLVIYLKQAPKSKDRFIQRIAKGLWLDAIDEQQKIKTSKNQFAIEQLQNWINVVSASEKQRIDSIIDSIKSLKALANDVDSFLVSLRRVSINQKELQSIFNDVSALQSNTMVNEVSELVDQINALHFQLFGTDIPENRLGKHKQSVKKVIALPEELMIENAGIVLLNPFFPVLFKNFNLLSEKGEWNSMEDQARAIYLLHYFATGIIGATEDEVLLLKILVGYDLEEVLPNAESVFKEWINERSEQLISEEENLLNAVRDNWKTMKNCSWEGLRRDFLRRSGTLSTEITQQTLTIDPHALDVLLPYKNWGVSLIKYSWMNEMLHVDWK